MKKVLIFISAAALLFASCTKIAENGSVAQQPEITFQTAAHVTKVDGSVFPTTETFSVYAWTAASTLPYFMNNVTVGYDGASAWKPQGETYYWPKYSTVDFIAYYPTNMTGIKVEENKITYTGINAGQLQQDVMYTDKAVGFSNNVDLMDDGVNAYNGVPLIFRHALAKVKFVVELAYNHKQEADGTITDWEVTINDMTINNIYAKGNCVLNLNSTPTEGIVGWTRPEDAAGNHVWTHDGLTYENFQSIQNQAVTPGQEYVAVAERYVLPQTLATGEQSIYIDLNIKTKRNNVLVLDETFNKTVDIVIPALPAWEMNHIYTYRLMLTPTASNGNNGNPIDPSNPVDPDDPGLNDVIITFDPAIDGWDTTTVETVLNI